MNIIKTKRSDVEILSVQGQLDATTSPQLESELLALVQTGAKRLLIDLAQVQLISSAALRVLLSAAKRMRRQEGQVLLCAPSPEVRKVFEVSDLASLFNVYETQDAALAAVTGSGEGAAGGDSNGDGGNHAPPTAATDPGDLTVVPPEKASPTPTPAPVPAPAPAAPTPTPVAVATADRPIAAPTPVASASVGSSDSGSSNSNPSATAPAGSPTLPVSRPLSSSPPVVPAAEKEKERVATAPTPVTPVVVAATAATPAAVKVAPAPPPPAVTPPVPPPAASPVAVPRQTLPGQPNSGPGGDLRAAPATPPPPPSLPTAPPPKVTATPSPPPPPSPKPPGVEAPSVAAPLPTISPVATTPAPTLAPGVPPATPPVPHQTGETTITTTKASFLSQSKRNVLVPAAAALLGIVLLGAATVLVLHRRGAATRQPTVTTGGGPSPSPSPAAVNPSPAPTRPPTVQTSPTPSPSLAVVAVAPSPRPTPTPTPAPTPTVAVAAASATPASSPSAAVATTTDTPVSGESPGGAANEVVVAANLNMNPADRETQQTRAAVLERIDLMPISGSMKDQLFKAVDRARGMGKVITINFSSGRTELTSADVAKLKQALQQPAIQNLTSDTSVVFVVLGFADSRGNEQRNKQVSERRAQKTIDALRGPCGVLNIIHSIGMGGSDLFDKQNSSRNRAVEVWAVLP